MTEFVTDTIWGMYPIFLDAGYSPQLFWELSVGEVNDLLESYARRKELEQKQREAMLKDEIMLLFQQALQIGNVVGALMDKNIPIKPPREYYPELFGAEKEEIFTEQEGDKPKMSPEMELHKARMDDFVFRHNMAMRKQAAMERGEDSGGDDAGKAPGDHRGPDKGLLRGAKESTAADAESD